jgi:hypothetical protein
VALLLLATRVRTAVVLPGGHDVCAVTEAVWVKIPLRHDAEASMALAPPGAAAAAAGSLSPPPLPPKPGAAAAAAAAQGAAGGDSPTGGVGGVGAAASASAASALASALLEFPVEGAHFFCETADVTRPFPWVRPSRTHTHTKMHRKKHVLTPSLFFFLSGRRRLGRVLLRVRVRGVHLERVAGGALRGGGRAVRGAAAGAGLGGVSRAVRRGGGALRGRALRTPLAPAPGHALPGARPE